MLTPQDMFARFTVSCFGQGRQAQDSEVLYDAEILLRALTVRSSCGTSGMTAGKVGPSAISGKRVI
jgi:hypothetical protein